MSIVVLNGLSDDYNDIISAIVGLDDYESDLKWELVN